MDTVDLGRRLRRYRAQKGWSIRECAEHIGITPRYLSDIEHGDKIPKMETFVRILNMLEASPDDVLQNSLVRGYTQKATRLEKELSNLTPPQRKQTLAVLNSIIDNFKE